MMYVYMKARDKKFRRIPWPNKESRTKLWMKYAYSTV